MLQNVLLSIDKLLKWNYSVVVLLTIFMGSSYNTVLAQYDTEHYIAPTGFTFYNETHRIYVSTLESNATVHLYNPIEYYSSNKTPLEFFEIVNGRGVRKTAVTVSKGNSVVLAIPNRANINVLGNGGIVNRVFPIANWGRSLVNETGTAASGEGLVVIGSAPVSVSIANLSDDRFIQFLSNPTINGNSSLTSKGKLALGNNFHVLNYRTLSTTVGQPVNYSILATEDNTQISINGRNISTLNKGQYIIYNINNLLSEYGINLVLGTKITATKPVSFTISSKNDFPPARAVCADAFADQMIPDKLAGTEYIAIRGKGHTTSTNDTFERINIVAINDNTSVRINSNGTETTRTLNANESYITQVGNNNETTGPYTTSYIKSDKPILVAQSSGQGCENGLTVLPPLSCTGSDHIETRALPNLATPNTYFPFDAYVLVKCGNTAPTLNDTELTNPSNILGAVGWQLYRFSNSNLNNTDKIIIDNSNTLMHVGMLQIGGLFTAYAYLSGFSKAGIIEIEYETPSGQNVIEEGCSGAKIIFKRVQQCDRQNVNFTFTGTATAGIDYQSPALQNNGIINFEPNELRKEVPITALLDHVNEDSETIDISFEFDANCDGINDKFTSTLTIEDKKPLETKSNDFDIECIDNTCPTSDRSVILTSEIFGGFPPYIVTWQDGSTEKLENKPYITSLLVNKNNNYPNKDGENIYTYKVADKCGDTVNGQVKLTKKDSPELSFTTPKYTVGCIDLYCNTLNEVIKAKATISGGTPPYVLTWENGNRKVYYASPFEIQLDVNREMFIKKMKSGGENTNAKQNYSFTIVDKCCKQLNETVTISNQCGYCAPNVITPNGDGYNDKFTIQNIEQYQDTSIIIFNRWGETVFTSADYKNEWGDANIPNGIYYYSITPDANSVLQRADNKVFNRTMNGIIEVVR